MGRVEGTEKVLGFHIVVESVALRDCFPDNIYEKLEHPAITIEDFSDFQSDMGLPRHDMKHFDATVRGSAYDTFFPEMIMVVISC